MIPLYESNEEASLSRVATIEEGLETSDRTVWRKVAERRIAALEAEAPLFGLDEHEEWELRELKRLLEVQPV
jgi:hypothetical protein